MTIARRRHIAAPYIRMSIKDWPVNERPREKALANGAQSLSDAELLAVLLGASHEHPLCCDAGVTSVSGVTGFGNGGKFGARTAR